MTETGENDWERKFILLPREASEHDIAKANSGRKSSRKYLPSDEAIEAAEKHDGRLNATLLALATHPDERVVRALLLKNPRSEDDGKSWAVARMAAYVAADRRATAEGVLWNQALDAIAHNTFSWGWSPSSWSRHGTATPDLATKSAGRTMRTAGPKDLFIAEAGPLENVIRTDERLAKVTETVKQLDLDEVIRLKPFRSRSFQDAVASGYNGPWSDEAVNHVLNNSRTAITAAFNSLMSAKVSDPAEAGKLLVILANSLTDWRPSPILREYNIILKPGMSEAAEGWSAIVKALDTLAQKQGRSDVRHTFLLQILRNGENTLSREKIDYLIDQIEALGKTYGSTYRLKNAAAALKLITAEQMLRLLSISFEINIRQTIAGHPICKDPRLIKVLSESKRFGIVSAVAKHADNPTFARITQKTLANNPIGGVKMAGERPESVEFLDPSDALPAIEADDDDLRLKGIILAGQIQAKQAQRAGRKL